MKRLISILLMVFLAGAVMVPVSSAHDGELDECGGHHNAERNAYDIHDQALYDDCKADGYLAPNGSPWWDQGPGPNGEPFDPAWCTFFCSVARGQRQRDLEIEADPNLKSSVTETISATIVRERFANQDESGRILPIAEATSPIIRVLINGQLLTFDVPPALVDGRTLVPLRVIFEALGATVKWDDATQTVTAARGDTTIELTIGSPVARVNGVEKQLDVPAMLVDGRIWCLPGLSPRRWERRSPGKRLLGLSSSKIRVQRCLSGLMESPARKARYTSRIPSLGRMGQVGA